MRTMMAAAATAATVLAAPLSALQVPAQPQSVYGECLRTDLEKSREVLKKAMDKGDPADDVAEVQKKITGCIYYQITLHSSVSVIDNEIPGVTSKTTGTGSITFGLAPDVSEPDYALTSGTRELTAPVYWVQDSTVITKPNCAVTTTVVPYTAFAFWLGVTKSPTGGVAVAITPDTDLHTTSTRCKDPLGRWTAPIPGKEAIFGPAWIKLHGQGEAPAGGAAPPATLDMKSLAAMDPAAIAAMAEKMKKNPTDMGDMMKLMKQVVPNADEQLAAARGNFMFKSPGKWCAADPVIVARCTVSDTVKLGDRLGYGTLKTIIESTVITIAKVSPPAGSP